MHGAFNHTEEVVRMEVEAARGDVHVEAEATRETVHTEAKAIARQVVDAVTQVRRSYCFRIWKILMTSTGY